MKYGLFCAGVSLSLSVITCAHAQIIEEVHVTAHPLSAEGVAQPALVLKGAELERNIGASIGETVARSPGIHSASFGKAVGRPVIHGLSGARVKVTEDRIDTLDVATTSTDHATTIEPFIAEQVEVLKGSSTLLYGSGAIGGVVDVHTGRIPHNTEQESISGKLELRTDNNAHTELGAFRLDGRGGSVGWHVDGFSREADEYEIPVPAESARQLSSEGEDPSEAENTGVLPGSQLKTSGGAVGLSWMADWGFAGVAVSQLESEYGLPGGHGHEEEGADSEPEGNPVLDLEQTRVDFELGVNAPFSGVDKLNLRIGVNDYEHSEIEPNGEVATRFENDAWEARLEAVHAPIKAWTGAIGLQVGQRDFSATGEEAFTPPVDTDSAGLFWVAERRFDGLQLEAGIRADSVRHEPQAARERSFTTGSASFGAVLDLPQQLILRGQFDYSGRAPTGEELFSNGPHLATNSFEIGNSELDEESAINAAITLSRESNDWWFEATAYVTEFRDFIYLRATGAEQDELPVFRYSQENATFHGIDFSAGFMAAEWDTVSLSIDTLFDSVRARLDDSGALPRIPANRYGIGAELTWANVTARVDFTHVRKQSRVSALELPTNAHDDLSIYLGADLELAGANVRVFLRGSNLTDKEQRNHTSFIKEFAPAPGRSIESGIRVSF